MRYLKYLIRKKIIFPTQTRIPDKVDSKNSNERLNIEAVKVIMRQYRNRLKPSKVITRQVKI